MAKKFSILVRDVDKGVIFAEESGYPIAIKPSFTLKREGHQIVDNLEDLKTGLQKALDLSPVKEVLLVKL